MTPKVQDILSRYSADMLRDMLDNRFAELAIDATKSGNYSLRQPVPQATPTVQGFSRGGLIHVFQDGSPGAYAVADTPLTPAVVTAERPGFGVRAIQMTPEGQMQLRNQMLQADWERSLAMSEAERDALQGARSAVMHPQPVQVSPVGSAPADNVRVVSGVRQYDTLTKSDDDAMLEAVLTGNDTKKYIDDRVRALRSGEDLRTFQQMLIDKGYDLHRFGADGKIGKETRAAARRYFNDIAGQVASDIAGSQPESGERELRVHENMADREGTISTLPIGNALVDSAHELRDMQIDTVATRDMPLAMTDAITKGERRRNRLTLWPEHAINQVVGGIMGDRGAEAAADVERTTADYRRAVDSGDAFEIAANRVRRNNARDRLATVPGRKSLTKAEKKQAMAILTELNGGNPFDRTAYERLASEQGKDAASGDYVGIGSAGYRLSNAREDRDSSIEAYDRRHGYKTVRDSRGREVVVNANGKPLNKLQTILRTDSRIYNDPNRGRMGSWSVRVVGDNIEIYDNFEATEAKEDIAKGKNDDSGYNDARASWKPGTTHRLRATIPLSEYNEFYNKVKTKGAK